MKNRLAVVLVALFTFTCVYPMMSDKNEKMLNSLAIEHQEKFDKKLKECGNKLIDFPDSLQKDAFVKEIMGLGRYSRENGLFVEYGKLQKHEEAADLVVNLSVGEDKLRLFSTKLDEFEHRIKKTEGGKWMQKCGNFAVIGGLFVGAVSYVFYNRFKR